MPTMITSAQVAASYGLSAAVSTSVPLTLRLEEAVNALQALEACQAQGWYELSADLRRESSERVFTSLKDIPEIVSQAEYRALEAASADPRRFALEVAALSRPLQQQAVALRQVQIEAQTEQLSTLCRIVSGDRGVAGLPDVRTVVAYQSLPDWARRVTYRNGKGEGSLELNARGEGVFSPDSSEAAGASVELAFRSGRYLVRDPRAPGHLDLRNLLGSAGVFVGHKEPLRLKPGVAWPVAPGGTIRLGKKPASGLPLHLPQAPRLEGLRAAIAVVPSLEALSQLLKAEGAGEIADQIDRYLKDKSPFDRLPPEGGLALKVQELVLKAEFKRLHRTYMPGMGEAMAAQVFRSLALAISESKSAEEFVRTVKSSMLPGATSLGEGIALFLSKPNKQSLEVMTEDFGIRDRIVFFSKEAAAKLQKQVEALGRDVAQLTTSLAEARALAAEKSSALDAAQKAAREQAARREAEQREHERVLKEKDRLHREEREALEESWGEIKAALEARNREVEAQMTVLEGARAQLQREKEAAETAIARLTTGIELAGAEVQRLKAEMGRIREAAVRELQEAEAKASAELEAEREATAMEARTVADWERRYEELNRDKLDIVGKKMEVDEALSQTQEELEALKAQMEAAKKPDSIVLVRGETILLKYEPERDFVFGRGKDADIRIPERQVSRDHFHLRGIKRGDIYEWKVNDRSEYGLRVNGRRAQGGWMTVQNGDVFSLGLAGGETRILFMQPDVQSALVNFQYPAYQTVTPDDLSLFLAGHATVTNGGGALKALFGRWTPPDHTGETETTAQQRAREGAFQAVTAFANLHENVPELKDFFTPMSIWQAKARGEEMALFERAQKTIEAVRAERGGEEFVQGAFGDLDYLKVFESYFEEDRVELARATQAILDAHYRILETFFGIESDEAAYLFAVLNRNVPEVAELFTPERLEKAFQDGGKAGVAKFFQLFGYLTDPVRHVTGQNRYGMAFTLVGDLYAKVGSPQRIRVRFRWPTLPTQAKPANEKYFVLGSGEESDFPLTASGFENIRLALAVFQQGWCIADVGGTGIRMNGVAGETNQWHVLTSGMRIEAGGLVFAVSIPDGETADLTQIKG